MAKAKSSTPQLIEKINHPVGVVKLVHDQAAFHGWKASASGAIDRVV
ncbi:hypothetical protein [Pedobacter sp. L105]|nr:hypothetical protein [Pedobacter sp. L105]